tara:strand:- start:1509 stop:1976 length:468 start_codon:yes stop_codon:yes gene_type:complete
MRINILAIESKRPAWAQKAFEYYQNRFDRSIQVEWSGIKPEKNYKSLDTKKIINKESAKLINSVKDGEIIISLDKQGTSWSTLELKKKFDEWLSSSTNVSFIIGGPDGLNSKCLNLSHEVWSLSSLTFPHSIVPVIVIEQLYRVWSINKNHPYHR